MTGWRGRTVDGSFTLELEDDALRTMDRYCRDAGLVETGGILVGRYSDDLSIAIVREATPPPSDSRRGRLWFVRGVKGLRDMLGERWRAKQRTYYIGEWHFHPVATVEPSSDDFAQMLTISRSRDYECKEPLLVILGTGQQEGQRVFRAFVCPDGTPLEFLHADDERTR